MQETIFQAIWAWLQNNHGAVGALASLATLVVWTLYFQMLLMSYRRTLRPKILINRGAGQRLQAHCLVANMSAEPIYIEAVLLDVGYLANGEKAVARSRYSLSELDLDILNGSDRSPQWFQGPLDSSEWVDIGTFQQLIGKVLEQDRTAEGTWPVDRNPALERLRELTVIVVATYRAQDLLVAARRSFDVEEDMIGRRLIPRHFTAEQIRSRRDRRALERMMNEGK
ncbi:hypothetical protein ACFPOD_01585 [Nitratireductor kimnyeongensis]|uniref:Uncharacterized protein n=1 Tax=Nitratireductor kimnyeongensis TaxID=430679 RepID=A0ABW0T360_9HYPH|nr:hypothetical protein [Nitratireductor kimnyeongensis]QZZ35174.1 hypothetical protein KW403_15615 [Nitratireductor kimnyeongensis]